MRLVQTNLYSTVKNDSIIYYINVNESKISQAVYCHDLCDKEKSDTQIKSNHKI